MHDDGKETQCLILDKVGVNYFCIFPNAINFNQMAPNIHCIIRKLTIVANLILFLFSFLLIKFGYKSIDPFYSSFNPLIVTLSLSGYLLIRSIVAKVFNSMFWIDLVFCYVIYGIVYYLGIYIYTLTY